MYMYTDIYKVKFQFISTGFLSNLHMKEHCEKRLLNNSQCYIYRYMYIDTCMLFNIDSKEYLPKSYLRTRVLA